MARTALAEPSYDDTLERLVDMVRVDELVPGDLVKNYPMEAVFITRVAPHPLFPPETGLILVIWFLHNEGEYSFDALLPMQEVGSRIASGDILRRNRLRQAFKMGGTFGG